jgi:hypothetical protein
MGDNYGPMVVVRQDGPTSLEGVTVAIPGTLTTAFLALRLYMPDVATVVMPFDEILEAVRHETPDPRRPAPRAVPVADEAARRADEALGSSLAGRSLLDLIRPAD